jgi:hypothetical protein
MLATREGMLVWLASARTDRGITELGTEAMCCLDTARLALVKLASNLSQDNPNLDRDGTETRTPKRGKLGTGQLSRTTEPRGWSRSARSARVQFPSNAAGPREPVRILIFPAQGCRQQTAPKPSHVHSSRLLNRYLPAEPQTPGKEK